jgi:cytoskeletal protein RodZ
MSKESANFGYVLILAVIIAFVAAFVMSLTGHALTANLPSFSRTNGCQSYARSMPSAYNGGSHNSILYHGDCDKSDSGKSDREITQDNQPVVTVVSDNPTVTDTVNPVVIPAENPTVENPTEKSCKNKNSGKDGTPAECNAGIGQEKQAAK